MMRCLIFILISGVTAATTVAQNSDAAAAEIQFHRPNYVIAGFDRSNQVKFQFSVRYRFVEEMPIYFAYTQRSFWDLYDWDRSTPFRESNYNPALFWEGRPTSGSVLRAVRLGVDHESNGKSGVSSRSWNRVFLEAAFTIVDRRLAIQPRLNAPFAVADENSDILDFVGPGEVTIEYTSAFIPDHSRLQITLRKGRGWNWRRFGWSADWLLRPQTVFGFKPFGLNPSLYLQFWRGYGESLIDYNHFLTRFRVGIRF